MNKYYALMLDLSTREYASGILVCHPAQNDRNCGVGHSSVVPPRHRQKGSVLEDLAVP